MSNRRKLRQPMPATFVDRNQARWNGQCAAAVRVRVVVADAPQHPQYWARDLVGTERAAVRVVYDPWGGNLNSEWLVTHQIEELTRGAHLVGAVPNFDAEVLAARMRAQSLCPSWHYHLVDVEALAAGHHRLRPPWGFDDILAMYGLTYAETERHTALGDARMARDLYDAIMGGPARPAEDADPGMPDPYILTGF